MPAGEKGTVGESIKYEFGYTEGRAALPFFWAIFSICPNFRQDKENRCGSFLDPD